MKLKGIEGIDEFNKIAIEATKKLAEEKFTRNGSFDIEELFNYESVNFTDKYEPIVLRSTKIDEPHKFTTTSENEEYEPFEELKESFPDTDIVENDTEEQSIKMKDWNLNRLLHDTDMYWDNSYKYDQAINEPIKNLDLDLPDTEAEDMFISHSSIFKREFNLHGNVRFEVDLWTDETGYIVPNYHLLKMQLDYISIEKSYSKIVKDFRLEKDSSLSKANEIGNFRNLLEVQLERQNIQLDKLNKKIKTFLIFYYRVLEASLQKLHKSKSPGDKNKTVPKDWFFCLNMFKAIYDTFYMNITEDKIIEFHCNEIRRNPYLPSDTKEVITDFLESIYEKKKPIIAVAREIALKARVTEAIIEGLIIDESLKSLVDVVESFTYSDLPRPEKVAKVFVDRPGNKRRKYGVDVIEPVMRATREYIIAKNDLKDMNGHVKTVADAKEFNDNPASLKSREKYVRFYAKIADRYKEKEEDKEATKSDSSTKNS